MKKRLDVLVFLLAFALSAVYGQTVDTIAVFSQKMNRDIKNVVVLPEGYNKSDNKKYPVLYLLHGHGGKYDGWINHTKKTLPGMQPNGR